MNNDAFLRKKIILFADSVIFLLCLTGIYQISEKAKLPFEINPEGKALFIKSEANTPYHILNNSKLISKNRLNVDSPEEIELVTDTKNIGDEVQITSMFLTTTENSKVILIRFYPDGYLFIISFTSLLFFISAIFILIRKPSDIASRIFHWACIGIACIIDLTWANNNKSILVPYYVSRIPFHFFYTLVPIFFLHFTFLFPNPRLKNIN